MVRKGNKAMQMGLVWAFDPGLHCGWAVWRGNRGGGRLLGSGEPIVRGPKTCMLMLDEMKELCVSSGSSKDGYPDAIVYEDFTLRPQPSGTWGSRVGLSPVSVACWIQGIAVAEGYVGPWEAQMPGQRKVISNDALRDAGWWKRGSLGHAHDAMRHLAVYLRKQGIDPDMKVVE